ncbi:MAG: response regulator [bacterium]|nr:response regulator [bacterium]
MKHVAVIEDNPDNRLLVRAILEDRYELTEFDTGMKALAAMQEKPPDLILLDISLPEMDGAEVLKRIRQIDGLRELPVVALTAHAMVGDRERFLAVGFDQYISKPILDPERLAAVVAELLDEENRRSD